MFPAWRSQKWIKKEPIGGVGGAVFNVLILFQDIRGWTWGKLKRICRKREKEIKEYAAGYELIAIDEAQKVGLDCKTVARYLDLLEKSFVIFALRGFSRNLRNEITKKAKYYFFDTGIRNALIANFNLPPLRNDIGQLWENFLLIERIKSHAYLTTPVNYYFWRTWEAQEIDLIEEREGHLFAYEFKWTGKGRVPKKFREAYPEAEFVVVNRENYQQFLGVSQPDGIP